MEKSESYADGDAIIKMDLKGFPFVTLTILSGLTPGFGFFATSFRRRHGEPMPNRQSCTAGQTFNQQCSGYNHGGWIGHFPVKVCQESYTIKEHFPLTLYSLCRYLALVG